MINGLEVGDTFYSVDILSCKRSFVPVMTDHALVAADGTFHYEDKGVQEQVELVLRGRPGREAEVAMLWTDLHRRRVWNCVLPKDDRLEREQVYVRQCEKVLAGSRDRLRWDQLRVVFQVIRTGKDA